MTTPHRDFEFLPLGAIIKSFLIPIPSSSTPLNIVQSFPTSDLYVKHNSPHFGETIGRVANRIAGGLIQSLNGKSYQLAQNDGENALHGGFVGWGNRIWEGPHVVSTKEIKGVQALEGGESVKFTLRDTDGTEGYPGTLQASVIYTTGREKVGNAEKRVLGIEYEVKLVGDEAKETVVNMTNHSYFNLNGAPTIENTIVTLATNLHIPLSSTGIPTTTTPAEFPNILSETPFTLGPSEPDVDDLFVFPSHPTPLDTRSLPLTLLSSAHHPSSGVHLEVLSTEPAFQFYTGKHIDVPAVEGQAARGSRAGFCVEPSRYVDAVNWDAWRNQVVVKKGEVYGSLIVYKGWSE